LGFVRFEPAPGTPLQHPNRRELLAGTIQVDGGIGLFHVAQVWEQPTEPAQSDAAMLKKPVSE